MKVKPCSSIEIWQSSVSDILKSIEGISLNEVADISAGISMFCSENNITAVKHTDLLLLVAKGLSGIGRLEEAKAILKNEDSCIHFTESWLSSFDYIDNFSSLFPFFSRGVVLPGNWSGLQEECMWVLDLNRLVITEEELHEVMVYQSIQVLLKQIIILWGSSSGKGVLAIRGLSCWSLTKLLDTSNKEWSNNLIKYIEDVLDKEVKVYGWMERPNIILL